MLIVVQNIKEAAKPLLLFVVPRYPFPSASMMTRYPGAFLFRDPVTGVPFSVLPVTVRPDLTRWCSAIRPPVTGHPDIVNGIPFNPDESRFGCRPPVAGEYMPGTYFMFGYPDLSWPREAVRLRQDTGEDKGGDDSADKIYSLLHYFFLLYYKLVSVALI